MFVGRRESRCGPWRLMLMMTLDIPDRFTFLAGAGRNYNSLRVTTMSLSSQSYIFDPRPNFLLLSTVKRYWKADSPYLNDPQAVTLIFTHGTGLPKEAWEPTIDDLYTIVERQGTVKIREIWSIDAQNHGDGAALNAEELSWGYDQMFRWEDYARGVHAILTGLGSGIDMDFSKHRLVGVGHSMGGASLILAMTLQPLIKFEALILVEPMIFPNTGNTIGPNNALSSGSKKRRDIWTSKEEAYTQLKSRRVYQQWDDRVLRIFVADGLTDLPTSTYPNRTEGVTLKTPVHQETICYCDELGAPRAYRLFSHFAQQLPIHLIYGTVHQFIAAEWKEDVAKQGVASVSYIPGAGHSAAQTHPTAVAERIFQSLASLSPKSKL